MFKGRVDNNGTLVDNPLSALRYIKTHQNWSELGSTYDWGKDYISGSLIKTSGEGSFNSSTLSEISSLKIARQLFSYNETWSDSLCQSLCEQFFILSYQDDNGYECVKNLLYQENPTDVITYADTKGEIGSIVEPDPKNIYCLPIINYGYDYATEKYTKQLKILNVWENQWVSDSSPGFSAVDGEDIWNTCHDLWLKTQQIEPMPDNLSNLIWVPDYTTAVWCLRRQLAMMELKRTSLNLPYATYRKWDVGKHFLLQLSHQTDNEPVECVATSVWKSKETKSIKVEVIILDKNTLSNNIYQDGDTGSLLWQNTTDNIVNLYQDRA